MAPGLLLPSLLRKCAGAGGGAPRGREGALGPVARTGAAPPAPLPCARAGLGPDPERGCAKPRRDPERAGGPGAVGSAGREGRARRGGAPVRAASAPAPGAGPRGAAAHTEPTPELVRRPRAARERLRGGPGLEDARSGRARERAALVSTDLGPPAPRTRLGRLQEQELAADRAKYVRAVTGAGPGPAGGGSSPEATGGQACVLGPGAVGQARGSR